MNFKLILGATCGCVVTLLTTTTNAALVDNGGGLIYDDVLNITWAQPDTINITQDSANTWVSGLTLGGVSGWRLPYISVVAGVGPTVTPIDCSTASESACRDNELGYMFYHNLGGTLGTQILDRNEDPDLILFPTLANVYYHSGTLYNATTVWGFKMGGGGFALSGTNVPYADYTIARAWAVHEGNIVPVPAAVWLFGSGLIGLVGLARRKAQS